jgi:two-component system sensor histidine kinase YesM
MNLFNNWLLGWIRKVHFNITLRGKLFLGYLIVAIVPISFVLVYSYVSTKHQLTEQTYTNAVNSLAQINRNIDGKLTSYSQISSFLFLDERLRNFLINLYDDTNYLDAYTYINSTLHKMMALNPDFENVTIYTENLTIPSDGWFIKPMGALSPALIQKTLVANGQLIVDPAHLNLKNEYVFTLSRILNYLSLNYPYGILTINIYESQIYSLIEKENSSKTVFITGSDDTILSTKDKKQIGHNLRNLFPGHEFNGSSSGSFDGMYEDEKVLVLYQSTNMGWKTYSVIPYRTFLNNAQNVSMRILILSLICFSISILLIFITSLFFTRRVHRLMRQIQRLERSDFEIESQGTSKDEIGQISHALSKMGRRIGDLINDVYKKEISHKEAEMNMLQAQINPHFLYNTLASISSLAIKQQDFPVRDMVNHLAKFYRISLNKGKKFIPIAQEIDLTRNYIAIQQIRFEGMLHLHYELDKQLFHFPALKLILQPIIENCIHHAIWDDERGIGIVIKLREEGEKTILFEIIDDGVGMTQEAVDAILRNDNKQESSPSGYGIRNVDHRIKLAYGDDYGVTLFSRPGIGTQVWIRLPR